MIERLVALALASARAMLPPSPSLPHALARHLLITGGVQGVGFRWSLVQQARSLGLSGWVRNRRDGSVEALATGPAAAVQALIEWAQRGPMGARVEHVAVTEVQAGETLGGFELREAV